jgi:hypothetical protein
MKRASLAALLLLGTAIAAHADVDHYDDITGRHRADDLLHVDAEACSARLGPPQNGAPTSATYKRCMRQHGWKFIEAEIEPGSAVCHATVPRYEELPFSLNHHNVATMTLRIRPPRGKAYETTVTKSVSRHSPPRQGGTMAVRCDPANPADIHPVD